MLLKAGASKSACENALMEACLCGQAKAAELLISSEMTGPDVAQHALVSACCRGFVNVVSTLIKVRSRSVNIASVRAVKVMLNKLIATEWSGQELHRPGSFAFSQARIAC